jgi:hypothetical protein
MIKAAEWRFSTSVVGTGTWQGPRGVPAVRPCRVRRFQKTSGSVQVRSVEPRQRILVDFAVCRTLCCAGSKTGYPGLVWNPPGATGNFLFGCQLCPGDLGTHSTSRLWIQLRCRLRVYDRFPLSRELNPHGSFYGRSARGCDWSCLVGERLVESNLQIPHVQEPVQILFML